MDHEINPAQLAKAVGGIKTFQLVQYITGYLEGEFDDWPNQIKDQILEALEKKAQQVELPLTIIHSRCDVDYGDDSSKDRFYIHVIASEIVAADGRIFRDEKEKLKSVIADIVAGRRTH